MKLHKKNNKRSLYIYLSGIDLNNLLIVLCYDNLSYQQDSRRFNSDFFNGMLQIAVTLESIYDLFDDLSKCGKVASATCSRDPS